jgi:hypothetical protein
MTVIRRVFKDQFGTEVLVEFWPDANVMNVALKPTSSGRFSPPLTELRNEDES